MGSLSYSSGALDTLPHFHRKKFVVYVEGQDDVVFWNKVLNRFGLKDFVLKEAGGAQEIEKYIHAIINDDSAIAVARDCDYTDLLGTQFDHPRILYTYGYSIENTLYCPANIANMIALHARTMADYETEVAEWLTRFADDAKGLLTFDFANAASEKGFEVLGENCHRFLASPKAHSLDNAKLRVFIAKLEKSLSASEVSDAQHVIATSTKPLVQIIKGCFLTHAIMNFVKWKVRSESARKIQLSLEHFFVTLVNQFDTLCSNTLDMLELKNSVERLSAEGFV